MWNSKTECQTTERKLKLNGPTRKIETQHKHNTSIILCVLMRFFNIGISLRLLTGHPSPDLAIAGMSVFQTRWLSWWQLAQAQGLTSNHLPGSNGKRGRHFVGWDSGTQVTAGDYGLWSTAEKPRDFILCFLLQGHPTDFPHTFLNVFFLHLW